MLLTAVKLIININDQRDKAGEIAVCTCCGSNWGVIPKALELSLGTHG